MSSTPYMLDTNVFNALRDGVATDKLLPLDGEFFATSIQMQEINANPDPLDRERLLGIFKGIAPEIIPTESAVWDVSEFGLAKYGDGLTYESILNAMNSKNKRKNNIQDALIAETSIKNGFTLVTSDRFLSEVVSSFNGKVCWYEYGSPINKKYEG